MLYFNKKKSREELILSRVDSVLDLMFSDLKNESVFKEEVFELTELEIVQIANEVRQKLNSKLKNRKNDCMSKATMFSQKSLEIQSAIDLLK